MSINDEGEVVMSTNDEEEITFCSDGLKEKESAEVKRQQPSPKKLSRHIRSDTSHDNTIYVDDADDTVHSSSIAQFDDKKFPQDSYSFLACHPPSRTMFFLFGLAPFLFQMSFIMLLLWSQVDETRGTIGENDNPDSDKQTLRGWLANFIPSNTNSIVVITQVIAVAYYMIYPDSSLQDVVMACRLFPRISQANVGGPLNRLRFSCILRGISGFASVWVVLLLVLRSGNVVDLILNFTAMSSISKIDDDAFALAISGEFGPVLKAEAERIANKNLPESMYHPYKHVYYRVVAGLISVLVFAIITFILSTQKNPNFWNTKTLRVQFQDSSLNQYSGCFQMTDIKRRYGRLTYTSFEEGITNTSLGYCRSQRQWILFEGDAGLDPCEASQKDLELIKSAKTDTFDISTSYDETWISSGGTPLDLYFFDTGEEEEFHCDSFLGDGKCDLFFNKLGYAFDDGDCCAATCTGSSCGRNRHTDVFGSSTKSWTGFPNCKEPQMLPIIIHLNSISSSRDPEFSVFEDRWIEFYGIDEPTWRREIPVDPYFALECNGKNVFTVYIEENMVNNSNTVMVEDGASCSIVVRNSTSYQAPVAELDDPIWFINYTLFHGEKSDDERKNIKILTEHSREKGNASFKRIPECYLRRLVDYVDVMSIYATSGPSNEAVDRLIASDTENSLCDEEGFIERYALVNMFLAMNGTEKFINSGDHCTWPSIMCSDGEVNSIRLQDASLSGHIPSEIRLLKSLKELQLSRNNYKSIPTEIRHTTNLEELHLDYNQMSSLPTDIGLMTSLRRVELYGNRIVSLPTEMGKMTTLQRIRLCWNKLTSLPTEIGKMTSLQLLYLDNNAISSVTTEIGLMTSLQDLRLDLNQLSSVPTAIGLLENLETLHLDHNRISSLPTSIGNLKSLRLLDLDSNEMLVLPTEIGLLTTLQNFNLNNNKILSLPTEIGQMVSLQDLQLEWNLILSLPTEIGLLTNLRQLHFDSNQILILPSEIGWISSLQDLRFNNNMIISIPSEISRLTNLQYLDLSNNMVSLIPSEIGLLTQLRYLDLRNNTLTQDALPDAVSTLCSLFVSCKFDF